MKNRNYSLLVRWSEAAKVILSLVFLFCFVSNSFFYHVHTVDGTKVIHSHFYLPDGDNELPEHTHSNYEFTVIALLQETLLTFFCLLCLPLVLILIRLVLSILSVKEYNKIILFSQGRSPPKFPILMGVI